MSEKHEQEYFDALKTITRYHPSEWFTDAHTEKEYGLPGSEALEMAYDNVLQHALDAIRGRKRPEATR